MPVDMDRATFEAHVSDALDQIPSALTDLIDNCVILVEDDPPPGQQLLGLYEGIPITDRDGGYAGVLPDRIYIFRNPILAMCANAGQVVDEVEITVVHEIAHHFGIDDQRLHTLGYG
ncbi:MAG: metallopeptidase family protein [Propionibacteriaceae bacterium]